MHIKNDLTGKQVGDWKIIELLGFKTYSNGKLESMWLCECKCGFQKETSRSNLHVYKSSQCRQCANKIFIKDSFISNAYWYKLQKTAKERNIKFNITKDYAYK